MNKKTTFWLSAAVIAALILCVVLGNRISSRLQQVNSISEALKISQSSWQQTAAEKEGLQDELKIVQNNLREAELTLSESLTRASELEAEIRALEEEISMLKGD